MGTRRGGAAAEIKGVSVLVSTKDAAPATSSIMELINDDLVLVILDFVDVKAVLAQVSPTSHRLRLITK